MKLKTYQGKTMADALGQVKRHLGRDAVILSTRTFTRGGVFGLCARPVVEVTAVRDLADLPPAMRRSRAAQPAASASPSPTPREAPPPRSRPTPAPPAAAPAPVEALMAEIGSLKHLVSNLVQETRRSRSAQAVPGSLYDTYTGLVSGEVAECVAQRLIDSVRADLTERELHDADCVRGRLADALKNMLPTAGPIQLARPGEPTVIALVGPTGVGKTTTVAKLAANFCLREKKRVGLITIDTYRIAAVEQLRTYAQIIDVPLEIVVSPAQLREAVGRMSDCDVILIDTAGRSQRDAIKIRELRSYFEAVTPHETHLVLSSTCGASVLMEAIERFRGVGVDRVIFTKLDEAIGFGVILTCLQKANARLSYLTTGQDVPDDIEVGEPGRLAELILCSLQTEQAPAAALAMEA
jgi:flagellar biosynthesis protein FlhF